MSFSYSCLILPRRNVRETFEDIREILRAVKSEFIGNLLYRNIRTFEHNQSFDNTAAYQFKVYDAEEAINKLKYLCQPNVDFSIENKCWFYLITYYLHTLGYVIKEFPRLLARPPVEPTEFTYRDIRNRIIASSGCVNGVVPYASRRIFVEGLTFEQINTNIEVTESINRKFVEISNRQAPFSDMHIDEKIAEIINLIENMLKQNGEFISLKYEDVCCGFIDDDIVKSYRKKMQCFRHCTDEAIAERKTYSEAQKTFLVDYGLTIVKAIRELIK